MITESEKCLPHKQQDLIMTLRTHLKAGLGGTFVIPALRTWRKKNLVCLEASQPSLFRETKLNDILTLEKDKYLRNDTCLTSAPLLYMKMPTHTNTPHPHILKKWHKLLLSTTTNYISILYPLFGIIY